MCFIFLYYKIYKVFKQLWIKISEREWDFLLGYLQNQYISSDPRGKSGFREATGKVKKSTGKRKGGVT